MVSSAEICCQLMKELIIQTITKLVLLWFSCSGFPNLQFFLFKTISSQFWLAIIKSKIGCASRPWSRYVIISYLTIIILSLSQCEQLSVGPLESKMYVPTKLSYSELKELVAAKLESYTQNLHWKLGQQAPSLGSILAYLETTALKIFS